MTSFPLARQRPAQSSRPISQSARLGNPFHAWLSHAASGWLGLILGASLLVLITLAFVWELTYARIHHEKQQALQGAIRDNSHIVTVVKADLEQVMGKIRIYGDLSAALLEGDAAVAAHMSPTLNGDRALLRLAVFTNKGKLSYSSAHRRSEPEFAGLIDKVLAAQLDASSSSAMVVGRAQSALDAWRVPLLMGVPHGKDGIGFLAALLDLGYFLQVFQDVNLGPGGRIEIIGADGYQLVELSGKTFSSGRDFHDSDYLRFLSSGARGDGLVMRRGDRSSSIVAFSHLEKYPFTIVVSQDYEDLVGDLNRRRASYIEWAAIISLLVILCTGALIFLFRRQRAIHKALERSEEQNKKLIRQLEDEKGRAYQLASHDHLTGLPNRMLFTELAVSHILRARRSRQYHAILFIDLDRFKIINDTLGHQVGDLLLKAVSLRFKDCLRETDVVSRFGGDEFVMLVNDMDSIEGVALVAEKLVKVISAPFLDLEGHDVEIGLSIGIALCPQDGDEIEELLKNADAAMYLAKAAGRGIYRFHDLALNKIKLRQMELVHGLRRGIRENEFVLHYQPRVDALDFSLLGMEALVRWQHPDHGLIFPNDFIFLAEENDLISPLGYWVIKAACLQLLQWKIRGLNLIPVAVNVSAKQFRDEGFVAEFLAILQQYGIAPALIEIEITESCVLDHQAGVVAMLEALVAAGIKVVLDDYGTGFANIGHVKSLPLDAVKIDRSFVRELHNGSSDEIIVSSTITLVHKLGLKVVAEGVETQDQVIHLRNIGCDQLQGYYFSRPVAADAMDVILRAGEVVR